MKTRLYIFSFISVASIILLAGFLGITVLSDYMQKKYEELQLETTKRQAENTAKLLEVRLKNGTPKKEIIDNLQEALENSGNENNYICMFDKYNTELICHPNKDKRGAELSSSSTLENIKTGDKEKTRNVILEGIETGGLLREKSETEIVYMVPVKGTEWMIASRENIRTIKTKTADIKKYFSAGLLATALAAAFLSLLAVIITRNIYVKKLKKQNEKLESYETKLIEYEKSLNAKNDELNLQKQIFNDFQSEIKKKNDELNLQKQIINDFQNEIKKRNDEINLQKQIIKDQLEVITVKTANTGKTSKPAENFAQNIHKTITLPVNIIKETFSDFFLLTKSPDNVNGSFYWFKKIKNIFVLAAGGITECNEAIKTFAVMSEISLLDLTVTEEIQQSENYYAVAILDNLTKKTTELLSPLYPNKKTEASINNALILIDTETYTLQYAGAGNPLYIIRNNKLTEVKADNTYRVSENKKVTFTNKRAELKKNDIIYTFSESCTNIKNKEKNIKTAKIIFEELIKQISGKPLSEQKEILNKTFEEQSLSISAAGIKI